MKIHGRKSYKAGPRDECGSPPYSILPIIDSIEQTRKFLDIPKEKFIIWEPATGLMLDRPKHLGLVDGLRSFGYMVLWAGHVRNIDFIAANLQDVNRETEREFGLGIQMILTNPPFSVALKRRFINQCDKAYMELGIPYALLMSATTIVEKVNGKTLRGCSVHIPNGRICYNMPNKGWGAREKPTQATFETMWYSKGLTEPRSIHYSDFDMSNHFEALDEFNAHPKGSEL